MMISIPVLIIICFAIILLGYLLGRLFLKSFADEMGKQAAQKIFLEQKTIIEETVRSAFSENLERVKGDITKENITHQIFTTDFSKKRFEKLDELSIILTDTVDRMYQLTKLIYIEHNEANEIDKLITEKLESVRAKSQSSRPFSDESLIEDVEAFVVNCYSIISEAWGLFTMKWLMTNNGSIDQINQYQGALSDFHKGINNLAPSLKVLQNKIKTYFKEITPAVEKNLSEKKDNQSVKA